MYHLATGYLKEQQESKPKVFDDYCCYCDCNVPGSGNSLPSYLLGMVQEESPQQSPLIQCCALLYMICNPTAITHTYIITFFYTVITIIVFCTAVKDKDEQLFTCAVYLNMGRRDTHATNMRHIALDCQLTQNTSYSLKRLLQCNQSFYLLSVTFSLKVNIICRKIGFMGYSLLMQLFW